MITIALLTSLSLPAAKPAPITVSSDAIYTLPASDAVSEPISFSFEEAQLHLADTSAKMVFRLPAILDGRNAQTFTLQGSVVDSLIVLQGKGAKANCTLVPSRTDCQITFENLKLNKAAAERFELESGATELSSELQAAREAFEHQAVGTITFFTK